MSKKREYQSDDREHLKQALVEGIATGSSDATAAIVGAAIIDDTLDRTLRFHFRKEKTRAKNEQNPERKVLEQLLGDDGILSSFSAKAHLCFALGLIGSVTYDNLNFIRSIRNKFAHNWLMADEDGKLSAVSFKSKQIIEWCGLLKSTKLYGMSDSCNARERYTTVCLGITVRLFSYMETFRPPDFDFTEPSPYLLARPIV